ncbi:hypothetical protein [Parendozoicomonas sp. Alg238-R29]|uniref:hypothetical protein n=1 Tax=Parendozoicomonas sp. Alg238-R29 TaxID=2993446 RepID=UPI00248D6E81|nr:hypothetical protein [Parendozoicomonas sp. Alg238-R29]
MRAVKVMMLILVFSGVAEAGMKDVPQWMRETHWTGYFTGCGHRRMNLDVNIYDDARYVLRIRTIRGYPPQDGFYGGYINFDPFSGKLQFNPETNFEWFSASRFSGFPAPLKAWDVWMFPPGIDSIEGQVGNCGNFYLYRAYQ